MPITIYGRDGSPKAELSPNDSSIQVKEIQGDNVLTLSFTLHSHVALDVDDYCDFFGERYWLAERCRPKQKSTVEWAYDLKLYGIESRIKNLLVVKRTDGEDDPVFTLTAPPRDHVALIVGCMNEGSGNSDWKVGQVDGTENITVDYHGKYCDQGLREIAGKVGAEFWTEGHTVNVCRCEHGEPVTLGYDCGLASIDPGTANNVKFYTRLFPVGSSRNIDPERYGHTRLQLPGGVSYVDVNADRYTRVDHYETDAFAGIYPRRTGTVGSVRSEDRTGDDGSPFTVYYFTDPDLPFDPDDCLMPGKVMRVSFQEGSELAGLGSEESGTYYFEVNFDSKAREFEIITVWPYDNGMQLPGGMLVPKPGDRYILWNMRMPDEYYALAEAEFLEAVNRFNEEHCTDIAVFKARTDHVWIEDNEVDLFVGRRVRLESREYFPETGYKDSRITRITRKVNLPSQMDIEIGDALGRSAMQSVSDSISEVRSYARSIAGSISLPDIIRTGDRTEPTDNNLYSARRSDREFIHRNRRDTVSEILRFMKGLESGEYKPGITGGFFGTDPESGDSFAEVARLYVRVKAFFEELTVIKAGVLAGKQYITPGGGIRCTRVEEITDGSGSLTAYRCWFLSEQDGEKTECKFIAGDRAISEMFNAKAGTANKVSNHRYWRLVTAVDNDALTDDGGNHYGYIELSASDCETGSDMPQTGDEICQLGSRDNPARQTAMVFSTVDADAPSIRLFGGIDSYSLDGKAVVSFGRDPLSGKIFFRLGADGAKQYLHYTQDGGLVVAGKISSKSTYDDGSGNDATLGDVINDRIADTDILFISHTSQTVAPVLPLLAADGTIAQLNGWTTDAPAAQAGLYIWQTTYVLRGDGTASFVGTACVTGRDGSSYTENLLTGTRDFTGGWDYLDRGTVTADTYKGCRVFETTRQWGATNKPVHLEPGTYTFSAYAKVSSPEQVNIYVNAAQNTQPVIGTDWQRVRFVFRVDTAGTYNPRIEKHFATSTVLYTAGWKVEEGDNHNPVWSPAPAEQVGLPGPGFTENLLLNSMFSGWSKWSTSGSAGTDVIIDTARTFEGRNSVKVHASGLNTSMYYGVQQHYTVKEGETFTASVWAYAENPADIDIGTTMELAMLDSSDSIMKYLGGSIAPAKANEWQQSRYSFTVPAGVVKIRFFLYLVKNGTVWFSSPKLERGENPTPVWTPNSVEMVGQSAKVVIVNSDATAFMYEDNFNKLTGPNTINLTATLQGTTGYQWSYKTPSMAAFVDMQGMTSATYSLTPTASGWGSDKSMTLRCTSGGVHDEVTIAKVSSGAKGSGYTHNLLLNTAFTNGFDKWYNWGTPTTREVVTENGKSWFHLVANADSMYQGLDQATRLDVVNGATYTFSALVRGSAPDQQFSFGVHYVDANMTIVAQTWQHWRIGTTPQRVERVFGVWNNPAFLRVMIGRGDKEESDIYITDVKLEKGENHATVWSPAASEMLGTPGEDGASYSENLLLKSGTPVSNDFYNIANYFFGDEKPVDGKVYTLTIWGEPAAGVSFGAINSGADGNKGSVNLSKIADGVYSGKWTWKNFSGNDPGTHIALWCYASGSRGTTSISRIKFEKGDNHAPVWTPNSSEMVGTPGANYTENLVTGSRSGIGWSGYTRLNDGVFEKDNSSTTEKYIFAPDITIEAGKKYTLSFQAKATANLRNADLFLIGEPGFTQNSFSPTTQWQSFSFVNTSPQSRSGAPRFDNNASTDGTTATLYIKDFKIEEGENPNPAWTPNSSEMVGTDAYTMLLTNESHTFAGDSEKAVESSADCGIVAYKGATRIAATIGTISGMPSGMTVAVSGNGTLSAKFTVSVTTSLSQRQGTLSVPVTVDGKTFDKVFSWSLSLQGPGYTSNMLPGTKDWNGWGVDSGYSKAGTYNGLDVMHGTSPSSGYRDLTLVGKTDLEADTVYTLSMWAKGTGQFYTYVYPDVTYQILSIDGTMPAASTADTSAPHTLTAQWKRYYVVFRTFSGGALTGKHVIASRLLSGNNEIWIAGAKLEKGENHDPQWSPYPSEQYGLPGVDATFSPNLVPSILYDPNLKGGGSTNAVKWIPQCWTDSASASYRIDLIGKPIKEAGWYSVYFMARRVSGAGAVSVDINDCGITVTPDLSTIDGDWRAFSGKVYVNKYIGVNGFIDFMNGDGIELSDITVTKGEAVPASWLPTAPELTGGSDNLLLRSDVEVSNAGYPIASYRIAETLNNNETLTCTIWGELKGGANTWGVYNSSGYHSLTALRRVADGVYSAPVRWVTNTDTNNDTLVVYPAGRTDATAVSTIRRIKLERGTIPTPWSRSSHDFDFITAAMKQDTEVINGLILSALMKLGVVDESGVRRIMAGINGIVNSSDDLALWAGGDMVDAAKFPTDAAKAAAAIRHSGTAYFANNVIRMLLDCMMVGDNVRLDKDGLRLFSDGKTVLEIANKPVSTDFSLLASNESKFTRVLDIDIPIDVSGPPSYIADDTYQSFGLGTLNAGSTVEIVMSCTGSQPIPDHTGNHGTYPVDGYMEPLRVFLRKTSEEVRSGDEIRMYMTSGTSGSSHYYTLSGSAKFTVRTAGSYTVDIGFDGSGSGSSDPLQVYMNFGGSLAFSVKKTISNQMVIGNNGLAVIRDYNAIAINDDMAVMRSGSAGFALHPTRGIAMTLNGGQDWYAAQLSGSQIVFNKKVTL
ncbi:MAG: carbohydrate binding domain-containing protein [Muribaculaceae bacterium]|nr:carbohydrate binding domain-containing protein [Muribaculaceae bacterium]